MKLKILIVITLRFKRFFEPESDEWKLVTEKYQAFKSELSEKLAKENFSLDVDLDLDIDIDSNKDLSQKDDEDMGKN